MPENCRSCFLSSSPSPSSSAPTSKPRTPGICSSARWSHTSRCPSCSSASGIRCRSPTSRRGCAASSASGFPEPDHLLEVLRDLDVQVQGDRIVPGRSHSVVAPARLSPDALPTFLATERSPEGAVRDLLRDAARSRGFRMLVTPPEKHAEFGPSVARSLGARWLSFEDAFFTKYAGELVRLERAERFTAQRDDLTEAAEELLFELLEEHVSAGQAVVLGDTALLRLCGALDLPRRLYDETLSGERGFWVLVVPGVIHLRQPRFNEGPPMWQLQGPTLPLNTVLPA